MPEHFTDDEIDAAIAALDAEDAINGNIDSAIAELSNISDDEPTAHELMVNVINAQLAGDQDAKDANMKAVAMMVGRQVFNDTDDLVTLPDTDGINIHDSDIGGEDDADIEAAIAALNGAEA